MALQEVDGSGHQEGDQMKEKVSSYKSHSDTFTASLPVPGKVPQPWQRRGWKI